MFREGAIVGLLGAALVGCAGPVAAPSSSPSFGVAATPIPTPSPPSMASPTPTLAATPTPTPEPGLAIGKMATVVADSVVVRTEPGRQSAFVVKPCTGHGGPCPNLLLGPNTEYTRVYLMYGPVEADGYQWYLAAVTGPHTLFAEQVGWVPAGDSAGPWLVPAETACPPDPIDLAGVTYAAIPPLDLLACVSDRELTLTGWLPAPPSPEGASDVCRPLPDREAFCDFGYAILRPVEGTWAGSADHLPWLGETAAGLSAPPRDAWVTIRGSFNHPASIECQEGDPYSVLLCQTDFIVTSISTP